MSLEIYHKK